jgi:peptidoglycan/xylan/chitin deacetylase (PgdA/CDA1 family)
MKRRLRDACIIFIEIIGISYLYRSYVRRNGPLVRVVVFHDVTDGAWFARMIGTLCAHYHMLTPENFSLGNFDTERINVLVTFDDGYQSWVDVCLPILQAHNVKALFFVNSGLLDVAGNPSMVDMFMKDNLCITPRHALTWKGAGALVSDGQTVGGHSRTHANLTLLQNTQLEHEITDDMCVCKERLSQVMSDFAYPFGTTRHINAKVILTVRDAGYVRAYTAISRFVPQGETFMIPRICIETGLSPKQLKRWVEGSYDLFDIIKNVCLR